MLDPGTSIEEEATQEAAFGIEFNGPQYEIDTIYAVDLETVKKVSFVALRALAGSEHLAPAEVA